ncbi:MAG TPA: ATP-binding cassette domain-containing protein [Mycobacteriales bacterium]|nr:ATP-binding cassette domain-containing protein [Mycobacteriales bacterium]
MTKRHAMVWLVRLLAVPAIAVVAELIFGWGTHRHALGFLPVPNGVPFGNLVEGAIFGLLYALPAFGLILVYRAQRIINFAAASLGGGAAVLGLLVITQEHQPYLVGVAVALISGALLGRVAQRILSRFANKSRLVLTVATIGVAQIFTVLEVVLPSWFHSSVLGASQLHTPFSSMHFSIGQVVLSGDYLAIIVVAAVVTIALGLFFRVTRTGLGVRASADNADRAMLLGIPVRRMVILVWMIAGLLSAASAFLKIAVVGQSLGANIDPSLLLFPLAAAVIARFDDLPTALIAGIGLGIVDRAAYYSTNNPNLPVALVLPIVLVALLGRRQLSRAFDSGIASFQTFAESRPVPMQLRRLPEVVWAGRGAKVTGLAIALVGPYIVGGARLGFLTQVVLSAIVALSLTMLTGWGGQVSLGQFGIAGIGAAVAGGLATRAHADFFVTLLAAAIAGALIAALIGIPALRLPGLFLAVVTLAFSADVALVLLDPRYFGWMLPKDGQIIQRPVLFGRFDTSSDRAFYYLCLGFLVLFIASAVKLRASRSGRVFIAQRDNVRAAQALGVNAARTKIAAFALSGAIAAVGGALFAYQVGAIDPTTFPVQLSLDVFVFAVVGGIASPYGAVCGAIFYQVLNFFGSSIFGFLDHLGLHSLVGVIDELGLSSGVLIVLSLFPGGIASTGTAARDRFLRRVATRRGIELPSLMADRVIADAIAAEAARFHTDDPTDDALLVCRDLDVGYDGVQVLFGVDMHVRRGEVLALLGTNGAGKSTLLRAISGLTMPSAGTVVFDGHDITKANPVERARSGIAQVPGGKGIFPTVTVADHFRAARWIGAKAHVAHADAAQEQVLEWFPNLRNRWDTLAGNLSGGEAQQLAVGMAFITRPQLLIIDELSLGLAPSIVGKLLDVVRDLNATGTTVILVEQSVNVALTIAERAYFMEKGEVRFCGSTAELLERDDIVRSVFLAAANGPAQPEAPKPRKSAKVAAKPPVKVSDQRSPDVLRVTDLSISFGGVRAVDSVSFTLHDGEILGLIGPNGAGKTTVFDMISGFLRPAHGTVWFAGQDLTGGGADVRGRLGLGRSFQDARIFPSLSVAENIATSLERHLEVRDHLAAALGMPDIAELERNIAWTVSDLVELLALGNYRDKLVRELSTGTRRMVDIAMALAYDPTVLLLDEPSSGIAQRETEALGPMLLRIRDEANCSLLVIEHDMPLICAVSDRLLALEQGRVIASGPPQEVLLDPQVVASYLGDNEATRNRSGAASLVTEPEPVGTAS